MFGLAWVWCRPFGVLEVVKKGERGPFASKDENTLVCCTTNPLAGASLYIPKHANLFSQPCSLYSCHFKVKMYPQFQSPPCGTQSLAWSCAACWPICTSQPKHSHFRASSAAHGWQKSGARVVPGLLCSRTCPPCLRAALVRVWDSHVLFH